MQALLLAAGMGRRLGKYTQNKTKCMVKVGGKTLFDHMVEALREAGIRRLIIVSGYEAESLEQVAKESCADMELVFVHNQDYAVTNNIYSLWLARQYLAEDDTILLESDLIYDKGLLKDVAEYPYENVVTVAKYAQWMDGTVTLLSDDGYVREFIEKKDFHFKAVKNYYKTVNIYKFSKEFSRNQYIPFLDAYINAYGNNQYYELVLKTLSYISKPRMKAYMIGNRKWYEIDDAQDLMIARTLFAEDEEQLERYCKQYGGYWRYDGLEDFCYLVNPYFPPKKMERHMQYAYNSLLRNYPSGMDVQQLLASEMFHLDEKYLLVGNGAAELINVLGRVISGKAALNIPAFNEYVRCFKQCDIEEISSQDNGFQLDKAQLIKSARTCDVLFVVNPDNPSGSFLGKEDMIDILEHCKKHGVLCVVDESFADFAEKELRYTLLSEDVLEEYPNLVVIKSISKSYGVPGLRLGILATSDGSLKNNLRALLPVWNINSFGEYFMQIYSLYASQYENSCDEIARQRAIFIDNLKQLDGIKVYHSQANYIMCEILTDGLTSAQLATRLVRESNILIKDLSDKRGFGGRSFIRLAIKGQKENQRLCKVLKKILR